MKPGNISLNLLLINFSKSKKKLNFSFVNPIIYKNSPTKNQIIKSIYLLSYQIDLSGY